MDAHASSSHARGRDLLNTGEYASADAEANITVVTTGRELQAAIDAGAQDILIREHLDLTGVPLSLLSDREGQSSTIKFAPVLREVRASTQSIRVRCYL